MVFRALIASRLCAAAALAGLLTVRAYSAPAVKDFTFLHASDIHAPMEQSAKTLARVKDLGNIDLKPYSTTVPAPSFALATGDLTEFGGGNGWFQEYQSYWKDCGLPVYHQLGNHDNTWHANLRFLREAGQRPYYSFDTNGCHFVGLMTPTVQDPRPSIAEEQLLWLAADLARLGPQVPVFVFFHHPLGGSEFASRYDWERLLDVLRKYNTVLLMAGHSHGFVHRSIGGFDQVTGGSTFGANAGFSVISVKDGVLRVAYWKAAEPAPGTPLLEKTLPEQASLPEAQIVSPQLRATCRHEVEIELRTTAEPDGKVRFTINDEQRGELSLSKTATGWSAKGSVATTNLVPGAHYLRVEFETGGKPVCRSTHFFYDPMGTRAAWRSYLQAASKTTPACSDGLVVVGDNWGFLRAFDSKTGRELWSKPTGSEILGTPLIAGKKIIASNGAGTVAAYDRAGARLWRFEAGEAVYSSPVLAGENVVFGANDGVLYAVNSGTGKLVWTNSDAGYAIESQPCVWEDRVFYGAWDQHVRCVEAATGKLLWKQKTEGVRKAKAAHRYFSPGDAAPVLVDHRLLVADRNYALTILDPLTGEPTGSLEKVAAVSAAADGKHAFLRRTDGRLTKTDGMGKEIWSVPAGLGAIPTAPTEHAGRVYVCSATGLVSAFSSADGSLLWKYSVSPRLYVMSSLACDGERVYATSFDGSVTALLR